MSAQPRRRSPRARGAAMVEFLIVGPLLLLIGLGVVQVALLFSSRSALTYALQEAARAGSTGNASMKSIEAGLKRGLVPYMGGGRNLEELTATRLSVEEEFLLGTQVGWIRMTQRSPTPQSFDDWSENSVDDAGNPVQEIPNANLAILRCIRSPKTTAGERPSTACGAGQPERIGGVSRQTLADANLLKLQLTYGVKLDVPLIGNIVLGALSMSSGCAVPEDQHLGAVDLPAVLPGGVDLNRCRYYLASRIPVTVETTVRMQSPTRALTSSGWFTIASPSRVANNGGVQLGNGTVDDPASISGQGPANGSGQ